MGVKTAMARIKAMERLRDERDRLAKERRELLQLVWALVKLRGGTVVVTHDIAGDAMNERNRLEIERDERDNVVLRATRVETN